MNRFALITGGSRGIGRSLAFELASRSYPVALVAREENELRLVTEEIRNKFKVSTIYLAVDLSETGSASRIHSWWRDSGNKLGWLVNNAGYGMYGWFDKMSLSEQIKMLQVNIESMIQLTHQFIPELKRNKPSYILNVSSLAAFQALPTMSAYSASKSFVLQFSRSLSQELKKDEVTVTCLCPGAVATGFNQRAKMEAMDKLTARFNMSPDRVAKKAIAGALKSKKQVIPGLNFRISALTSRILPRSVNERFAAQIYLKHLDS